MAVVVYSKHYDISCFGVERLHPFDSRKYGRAWKELSRRFGRSLEERRLSVDRPASEAELLLAHSAEYLARIRSSAELAAALEIPQLLGAPSWLLRWRIVRPMLWAVRGTELAARAALREGIAINMSGGYHHAKPDRGEGFCLFSDIAIAVRALRRDGALSETSRIVYIDLDAHQGNGVCRQFMDDPQVFLFDMYNEGIYPSYDIDARERIDCNVALRGGTSGSDYLEQLRDKLSGFLDSLGKNAKIELAIYNAGSDVVTGDELGGLELTPRDVLDRDLFVVDELRARKIPVAMLPSGGYTRDSYQLIAATVGELLARSAVEGVR